MEREIISLINDLCSKAQSPLISYQRLLQHLDSYAKNMNRQDMLRRLREHMTEVVPVLVDWEFKGSCTLIRREGVLESVFVHNAALEQVTRMYAVVEAEPDAPFPREEALPFEIPSKLILGVDVQEGFVDLLENIDTVRHPFIRLSFSSGIEALMVPREIMKTKLIECSIFKLHHYLALRMNMGYIHNKLEAALSGSISQVSNMLTDLLNKPKFVATRFFEADDFSFKFWSQFSNIVLLEFRDKKDKLPMEHTFCQAAHIVGLFIGFLKSLLQREQQRSLDLRQLETLVRKPPYAFTLEQLYLITDSKGVAYTQKYSREFIHDFITRTTVKNEENKLPYLVEVAAPSGREFFIQKDFLLPVFLETTSVAGQNLKADILEEWPRLVRGNTEIPAMRYDAQFQLMVWDRIKENHELLAALMNPHLIYIAREESLPNDPNRELVKDCFSKQNKLKPVDDLLKLSRFDLLREVYRLVPFYYHTPVIKQIFFMLRWIAERIKRGARIGQTMDQIREEIKRTNDLDLGSRNDPEALEEVISDMDREQSKVPARQADIARFRRDAQKLKAELVGPGTNLAELIPTLIEKWNPLVDPQKRDHLIEDVNSLVRDFLRNLRRTQRNRVPGAAQLRQLAGDLAVSRNLRDIKRKESLKAYIEVYMLKMLEEIFLQRG